MMKANQSAKRRQEAIDEEAREWQAQEERDDRVREFVADMKPSLGSGPSADVVLVHPDGASWFYDTLHGLMNIEGGVEYGDPIDTLNTMDAEDVAKITQRTLAAVEELVALQEAVEDALVGAPRAHFDATP